MIEDIILKILGKGYFALLDAALGGGRYITGAYA